MPEPKTWWAPVWRGLVADPTGKHVRAMGSAVWLFAYLILHADRRTGVFRQRQATIAAGMGLPIRTVRAWMERLNRHGYVAVKRTGRTPVRIVRKWRMLARERQESATQSGRNLSLREAESWHSVRAGRRNREALSGEIDVARIPNKSAFTRILQQEGDGSSGMEAETAAINRDRRELLASDLAQGLGDETHLGRYRRYANALPEELLRRCLSAARAVPEREIKRSRAALFQYLIRHHGKPAT